MPIWLTILLQVLESVISHVIANPPGPNATPAEVDEHAVHLAKLESARSTLMS